MEGVEAWGCMGFRLRSCWGVKLWTSCSSGNVELCKRLGADEVVDYRMGDVVEQQLKERGGDV